MQIDSINKDLIITLGGSIQILTFYLPTKISSIKSIVLIKIMIEKNAFSNLKNEFLFEHILSQRVFIIKYRESIEFLLLSQ